MRPPSALPFTPAPPRGDYYKGPMPGATEHARGGYVTRSSIGSQAVANRARSTKIRTDINNAISETKKRAGVTAAEKQKPVRLMSPEGRRRHPVKSAIAAAFHFGLGRSDTAGERSSQFIERQELEEQRRSERAEERELDRERYEQARFARGREAAARFDVPELTYPRDPRSGTIRDAIESRTVPPGMAKYGGRLYKKPKPAPTLEPGQEKYYGLVAGKVLQKPSAQIAAEAEGQPPTLTPKPKGYTPPTGHEYDPLSAKSVKIPKPERERPSEWEQRKYQRGLVDRLQKDVNHMKFTIEEYKTKLEEALAEQQASPDASAYDPMINQIKRQIEQAESALESSESDLEARFEAWNKTLEVAPGMTLDLFNELSPERQQKFLREKRHPKYVESNK